MFIFFSYEGYNLIFFQLKKTNDNAADIWFVIERENWMNEWVINSIQFIFVIFIDFQQQKVSISLI